ncbi:MAG: hypothetical protein ACTSRG_26100 [Candidatus Helarchaeota archaeon]
MTIKEKLLYENYILEIISRSRSVKNECKVLLTSEFITEAPTKILKTINKICDYLEEVVYNIFNSTKWEDPSDEEKKSNVNLIEIVDYLIREFASHLRLSENAKTAKIPWNIIESFEKYVKDLDPKINIMLTSQWEYNYTVITYDLYKNYSDSISELGDYLPNEKIDGALAELPKPLFLIFFPLLEKKNILLHCLLGHEIGHLFADNYFKDEKHYSEFFKYIQPILKALSKKELEEDKIEENFLFYEDILNHKVQEKLKLATKYWEKGLEEILADIIGTALFGPSILFSLFEICFQTNIDMKPGKNTNYYPPLRLRLKKIINLLENENNQFFPISNFYDFKNIKQLNDYFNYIKKISNDDEIYKNKIKNDPILDEVYKYIDKILEDALSIALEHINSKILKADELYKNIPELVNRIDNKITPNAYEKSFEDRKPAELVEIINATWFHRITWNINILDSATSKINKKALIKKDRMNRFALKAIEYSEIEKNYNRRQ